MSKENTTNTEQPETAAVRSTDGLGAFVPRGSGWKWELSDGRSVRAHPGERGEVYLVWKNGDRETVARLSNEAARVTAVALMRCVGTECDMQMPPTA